MADLILICGLPHNKVCPVKGKILIEKDTKVAGFDWPAKTTAFEINDDWSIITPGDRNYGWIDIKRKLHQDRPLGDIDPDATLSGGDTGLKISSDHSLYHGGHGKVILPDSVNKCPFTYSSVFWIP